MRAARLVVAVLTFAVATHVAAIGTNCGPRSNMASSFASIFPPETKIPAGGVKVAYFGDQGLGDNPKAVLTMIKNWGAEFILHQGDFDYEDDPAAWFEQIDSVLGPEFPYFASIGNHDVLAFGGSTGYQQRLIDRLERVGAAKHCFGDYGTNMACHYKGVAFVLSGVGTRGIDHADYIDQVFNHYRSSTWKVCSWHKNQRLFQIGEKADQVGYEVYDTCRKHGAMIATGHEHSWSRTYLMSNFATQTIANKSKHLHLRPGQSFSFVAGVGGVGIRPWLYDLEKNPWWASVGSINNSLSDGAVLCDYKTLLARCEFRDRTGKVWDSWTMTSTPDYADADSFAAAEKECDVPFLEYQVSDASDDVQEDLVSGRMLCNQETLRLVTDVSNGEHALRTGLRFRGVQLPRNAKVMTAHLQFFGHVQGADKAPLSIRIHGENGISAPFNCDANGSLSGRKLTENVAVWTQDPEGWEEQEVWTSPELKSIIEEISRSDEWFEGADLGFVVEGRGESRIAFSFDGHSCVAPSLVIELESECIQASLMMTQI